VISLVIHLAIACLWLFLAESPALSDFVTGLVIGFLLLTIMPDALGSREYVRRSLALLRFTAAFVFEFLKANFEVARIVLTRPARSIRAGFFYYDVRELTKLETLILAHLISLTPGSTSVEIHEDSGRILVHALDLEDPARNGAAIDESLRRPLLAITRPGVASSGGAP
jgi:multicomponent Na+:H+ antiporter subunit E